MKGLRGAVVIAAVLFSVVACTDEFDESIKELNSAYDKGRESRKLMVAKGQEVTDTTCEEMFTVTGADRGYKSAVKEFQKQRKFYFINGCMNRPKP